MRLLNAVPYRGTEVTQHQPASAVPWILTGSLMHAFITVKLLDDHERVVRRCTEVDRGGLARGAGNSPLGNE